MHRLCGRYSEYFPVFTCYEEYGPTGVLIYCDNTRYYSKFVIHWRRFIDDATFGDIIYAKDALVRH